MSQDIKYLITDTQLSFYKNEKLRVVNAGNSQALFHILKSQLESGDTLFETDNTPQITADLLKRDEKFLPEVQYRLRQIEEAGMPTEPFFNFVKNCPQSFLEDNLETLSTIGTVQAPLTWEGDLVLYQRASWAGSFNSGAWATESEFTPGRHIEGNLRASTFDWTMNTCPDAGSVFEVVVKAKDVISATPLGMWEVKALTQMSRLGLHLRKTQRSEVPVVEFLTNCIGIDEQNVCRIPYNAGTAAKLVNSLFAQGVSTESTKSIVPSRTLSLSC